MNAALVGRTMPALLSLLVRIAFRSGLETGPAASLTFHFLAAQLEKAFALAILALDFWFARVFRHVSPHSPIKSLGYAQAMDKAIFGTFSVSRKRS
jgi:hypothetical protein